MKYAMLPIHVLPVDLPVFDSPIFLDGKTLATVGYYGKRENQYSFQIQWKYRLFNKEKHVTTFIGESKFVLIDDNVPIVDADLDRLIQDLYLNFDIKWQEKTQGTQYYSALPYQQDVSGIRKQIIDFLPK